MEHKMFGLLYLSCLFVYQLLGASIGNIEIVKDCPGNECMKTPECHWTKIEVKYSSFNGVNCRMCPVCRETEEILLETNPLVVNNNLNTSNNNSNLKVQSLEKIFNDTSKTNKSLNRETTTLNTPTLDIQTKNRTITEFYDPENFYPEKYITVFPESESNVSEINSAIKNNSATAFYRSNSSNIVTAREVINKSSIEQQTHPALNHTGSTNSQENNKSFPVKISTTIKPSCKLWEYDKNGTLIPAELLESVKVALQRFPKYLEPPCPMFYCPFTPEQCDAGEKLVQIASRMYYGYYCPGCVACVKNQCTLSSIRT